jgi:ABC-2 type transport system permease protein
MARRSALAATPTDFMLNSTALDGPVEAQNRMQSISFGFQDAYNLTRRYVLRARHQPDVVIGTLVFPVVFVVLFGYIFGSSITVLGGHYRSYLMSGLFAQAQLYSSSSVAVAVSTDMSEGVIDRFKAMPILRAAVLIGRTLSALIVGLPAFVLMVCCALVVGWRPDAGFGGAVGAFALLLLFGQACAWMGAFIGVLARSTQAAEGMALLPSFLLGFVSNVFVDPRNLPGPLRVVADWNPLSAVVTAVRQLFGNQVGPPPRGVWPLEHPVVASLLLTGLMFAIFVPLSLRQYEASHR